MNKKEGLVKFVIRMPKGLHTKIKRRADDEGISMNRLFTDGAKKQLEEETHCSVQNEIRAGVDSLVVALLGSHKKKKPKK